MEVVGWASSIILLLTLVRQVMKQWREGSSEGVSKWLFVGQIAASTGFLAYSVHTKSAVFIVTNALLILNSIVGLTIHRLQRRAPRHSGRA